jgi:hypothetical protein
MDENVQMCYGTFYIFVKKQHAEDTLEDENAVRP